MGKDNNCYGKTITDIISVGYTDKENDVVTYHPNLNIIYIELGNTYIKFTSVEQYSKLKVEFVEKIDYVFGFEIEEDMEYANSSMIDIVLVGRDMLGNSIHHIVYYEKEEKDTEEICCRACEIVLDNGQLIFLDPSFLCGISIGGNEKKKYYLYCKSEDEKTMILNS